MFANLNALDYLIIILIGFSTIISIWRGFIREVLSFIVWVLAFMIAIFFSGPLATYLSWMSESQTVRVSVSFITLFLLTLIIGALISFLIVKLVDVTGLSGTNRFLGAIFGLLRGVLVITIIVFCLNWSNIKNQSIWKSSRMIPFFETLATQMQSLIPADIMEKFNSERVTEEASDLQTSVKKKAKAID